MGYCYLHNNARPDLVPHRENMIVELDSMDKYSYSKENGIWKNKVSNNYPMVILGNNQFYNNEEQSICFGKRGQTFSLGYIDIIEPTSYTFYCLYSMKNYYQTSSTSNVYNISFAATSSYHVNVMSNKISTTDARIMMAINGRNYFSDPSITITDYICIAVSRTIDSIIYYLNGIKYRIISKGTDNTIDTSTRANKLTFYTVRYNSDPLPTSPPSYTFEMEPNYKYFSLFNIAQTDLEIYKNSLWILKHCKV